MHTYNSRDEVRKSSANSEISIDVLLSVETSQELRYSDHVHCTACSTITSGKKPDVVETVRNMKLAYMTEFGIAANHSNTTDIRLSQLRLRTEKAD